MSEDILLQVVVAVKSSPVYARQLNESTDVALCSQLLVYIRYLDGDAMKEEYLFLQPFATTTREEDVFRILEALLLKHELGWESIVGLHTDGAFHDRLQSLREERCSSRLIHPLYDTLVCFGDEDLPSWSSRSPFRLIKNNYK